MTYNHMGNENQGRKPEQEDDNINLMLICTGVAALIAALVYVMNLN